MGKDLATRVAQRADAAPATTDGQPAPRTIYQLIEASKGELARALPKHMDPDRLARIALTTFRQTPKLLECDQASLLGALMISAQLGLEPGPLGHCYFLPFENRRENKVEVQWILGYKGIIELARRSGNISTIFAREVCQHDLFEFEYGLDERLVHKPKIDGDRGETIAFYGVAKFTDGGHFMLVMSKADVEKHRDRSRAKNNGPWATDYDAMGRKTVIRAMASFLPLSPELAGALVNDETVRSGDITADIALTPPPPQPTVIEAVPEPAAGEQADGDAPTTEPPAEQEPAADAEPKAEAPTEDACPACGEIPAHAPNDPACPMAAELDESTTVTE